jgi:hypothetical protein
MTGNMPGKTSRIARAPQSYLEGDHRHVVQTGAMPSGTNIVVLPPDRRRSMD